MTQKENVPKTHPHAIQSTQKFKNGRGKKTKKKSDKLPTEHHTITIRQDDTGSEVTSIHICIFTLVSSLILWYVILTPGRTMLTQLQKNQTKTQGLIFPHGPAWVFNCTIYFSFCTNVDINTPTHRLTPTATWLTQREAWKSRNK